MLDSNKSQMHKEYISRINEVLDYIETNLGGDLSLDTLAAVSGFSKFHFCRIFRGIIKETLLSYINRLRLERAVSILLLNPTMSITEIAMQLGFADSAVFARSFKNYYGLSASEARKYYSKNCKMDSKDSKAIKKLPGYNSHKSNRERKNTNKVRGNIEVRNIEEIKAIYIRHLGPYEELATVFQDMLGRLMGWAMARDLIDPHGFKLFSIYHDNPEFTEKEHLKMSICLAVSRDVEVEGEIGKISIPSGKYAIGHFELNQNEIPHAWDYMYGEWLPRSGFQPDHGYIFEMHVNDPSKHPENKYMMDIYLPVKPL